MAELDHSRCERKGTTQISDNICRSFVAERSPLGYASADPVRYHWFFSPLYGLCARWKNFAKKDKKEKTREEGEMRCSGYNDEYILLKVCVDRLDCSGLYSTIIQNTIFYIKRGCKMCVKCA